MTGLSQAAAADKKSRKYDKGEKRFKHVGRSAEASVDSGNPKKVVGKCPNNISEETKLIVLSTATAESLDELNAPFPSRMFAVYEGVIYDCRTTTRGESYHAYPYHGELLNSVHQRLEQTEDAQKHFREFVRWTAKHITVIG